MVVTLAFLLALMACGARPTPVAVPPAFQPAPVPTPVPEDAPLHVVGRFVGADEAQVRALLDRFTAETGLAVEYEGAGEVATLLAARVEAGATPDVILLPKALWLREMARAGAIPPLPPDVAATVREHFSPAWIDLVSHDGTLYGVPFDANAKSLLWARPAALNDGLSLASLDALAALAARRAERGEATFAVPGGAGWPLTDWFEHVLLAEAGPEVYQALLAHQIPWTDPRVAAAARAFVALLRNGWVLGGTEGAATLPLDAETFARTFDPTRAEAALWLGQSSIVTAYAAQTGLTAGTDFLLLPFPADGALIVVGSVAVATNERPATAALLDFLAQPLAVEPWARTGGFISPNQDLPRDAYPTELARAEADLLHEAPHFLPDLSDHLPPNLGFPYLGDQLREMLRRPDDVSAILAEIEAVARREQGRVGTGER